MEDGGGKAKSGNDSLRTRRLSGKTDLTAEAQRRGGVAATERGPTNFRGRWKAGGLGGGIRIKMKIKESN